MKFSLKNDEGISDVKVILKNLNKEECITYDMNMVSDEWILEVENNLQNVVYKFLINNTFNINDSKACEYIVDDNEEVWSVYMDTYYKPHIYNVNLLITDTLSDINPKMNRILNMGHNYVVAHIDILKITGTHSVTVIWNQPDGKIYRIEERAIHIDEPIDVDVNTKFWIYTNWLQGIFFKGIWTITVLLDGRIVGRDYFSINSISYDYCRMIDVMV